MIDKLNESKFLRGLKIKSCSLALPSSFLKLPKCCLDGERLSELSTICLFGCVVFWRLFALRSFVFFSLQSIQFLFVWARDICLLFKFALKFRNALNIALFTDFLILIDVFTSIDISR